ncbi:MAG: mercuric transport protein MerTP [Aureispira sp.]|nr:mercuric transport protein MerTP [Aureispira sp.]
MKKETKLISIGILTAIGSSLCCITPLLAILAGTSGLASSFAWLEPLRPYLIGLSVVVLGFAWYQAIKPSKQVDCNCDSPQKASFLQSKSFLGLVTVFSVLMLSFPLYAHVFYPNSPKETITSNVTYTKLIEFKISGMTCDGCAEHINHEIRNLDGIIEAAASYEKGNTIVKFDSTLVDLASIEQAINLTGYTITSQIEN